MDCGHSKIDWHGNIQIVAVLGPSFLVDDAVKFDVRYCMRNTRTSAAPFRPAEDEWAEWYGLSPLERWEETQKLWAFFLEAGGSLDPESDSQSPFDAAFAPRTFFAHGRPGVRLLRRGGV